MPVHAVSGWSGDAPDVAVVVTDEAGREIAVEHLNMHQVIALSNQLIDVGNSALAFRRAIDAYDCACCDDDMQHQDGEDG